MIVIIGAGVGGLVTAVILSKFFGKKVCVLEAHASLGGCLHTFVERGYEFDVGLHYVGGIESTFGRFFSSLANVEWAKLAGAHDVLVLPDGQKVYFGDKEMQRTMLSAMFSSRFASMYQQTVERCQRSMQVYYIGCIFLNKIFLSLWCRLFCPFAVRMMRSSTYDVISSMRAGEKAIAVCAYHWGDFGETPRHLSFAAHAMLTAHWWTGNFYPVGGPKALAQGLRSEIKKHGGDIRLGCRVLETKPGSVTYARKNTKTVVESEETFYACGIRAASKISSFEAPLGGESFFITYVAFDDTPTRLDLPTHNTWVMKGGLDHDENMQRWRQWKGEPAMTFISFNCAKDPAAAHNKATVSLVCPVACFERGDQYSSKKETIETMLCDILYEQFPHLKAHEVFRFSGSPSTFDDYIGTLDGVIYGTKKTGTLSFRAPDGTRITGADVLSAGVCGAAAGAVLSCHQYIGARAIPLLFKL